MARIRIRAVRVACLILLIAGLPGCKLLPLDGPQSPESTHGLPFETVPPGYSLPPTRDLLSPEPPATVKPIAPP